MRRIDLMLTLLTLLLCVVPLAVFAATFGNRWRFRWIFVSLYCATYVLLSVQGQFLTANHGGQDWQDHWAPKGLLELGKRRNGRSNVHLSWFGTLFWPLIVADNIFWHRTHDTDLL